jgi:probable HAF family extracellular repeat protein
MTDLGTLGGSNSEAHGINSAGQVAGSSSISGHTHAFVYSGGYMNDLGTLGGLNSFADDINDAGQVVGYSNTKSGVIHRFLYSNGVMTDLDELIPSGWTFDGGMAINNAGQIVATGWNGSNGSALHALLLSPVPEPQTWAMLLAGLILLGYRLRHSAASMS